MASILVDDGLSWRIKRAISDVVDDRVRDLNVDVSIRLTGRCETFTLKAMAQDAAMEFLGGNCLANDIVVQNS